MRRRPSHRSSTRVPRSKKWRAASASQSVSSKGVCAWQASHPALSKRSQKARSRSIRSEEHTSELQSLMRISYAVFCLTKKKIDQQILLSFQLYRTRPKNTTHMSKTD